MFPASSPPLINPTHKLSEKGEISPQACDSRRSGAQIFSQTAFLSISLLLSNPYSALAQTPEDVKLIEGYKSVTKLLDTWVER